MRRKLKLAWMVPILLAALLPGCGSDSVAPQDGMPAVRAEDAATQAALFSKYLAAAYQVFVDNAKRDKVIDLVTISEGNVSGSFMADYRTGGPGGDPSEADGADFLHVYTDTEQAIVLYESPGVPLVVATFDVNVYPFDGNPSTESGTLTGVGQLVAGDYTTVFIIEGVALAGDAWPAGGSLTYDVVGPHDPTVVFDGTVEAVLTVDGVGYTVNLDTGELSGPLGP